MGTAGPLSFTFFRLQRTGPGGWGNEYGVQGRGFPGHPIPSVTLWGQDCPFHLSPSSQSLVIRGLRQRQAGEAGEFAFAFILSLCLGLEIALPVSKALLAQSSKAGQGLHL